MLLQVLFTLCIMLTTIQTVIDLREREARHNKETANHFNDDGDELTTTECVIEEPEVRMRHYLEQTCPVEYNPVCNDPIYNKYHEFEYRCRYPIMAKSIVSINSTSFLELMKSKDKYGRDWCMVVMFYSENCQFSARLAPHFNEIAGKFENILPVAVDASDFTKFRSYRLNFRYGISGTPTVLLWVNGIGVARMGNKDLDARSIKNLITSHTDLVEKKVGETREEYIPELFFKLGAEVNEISVDPKDENVLSIIYTIACFLVLAITCVYHVRERILLSAPVLRWFQSKCGGPLCDDIYFLFYVAPPRHRAPAPAPAPQAPAPEPNEEVIELPPVVIEEDQDVIL